VDERSDASEQVAEENAAVMLSAVDAGVEVAGGVE
jgi:hypothetical protein